MDAGERWRVVLRVIRFVGDGVAGEVYVKCSSLPLKVVCCRMVFCGSSSVFVFGCCSFLAMLQGALWVGV